MVKMSKIDRFLTVCLVLVMAFVMLINFTACGVNIKANDLMKGISANEVSGRETDDRFIKSTSSFSIDLFKKSVDKEKNSLVSPLSVLLALSMTANGADGDTLSEMEKVLGDDISLDELNEYLYTYAKNLPNKEKSKFKISNSIWFRDSDDFVVEKSFLQRNADFFGADAYKAPFDNQTLKDINNWVKNNTDGIIDKILDQISHDSLMYLFNAIVFDAEWEVVYRVNQIEPRTFYNIDGSQSSVEMMISNESLFIDADNAKGFIKPYKNGDFSFVAILPDKDIDFYDFVESLSGESFLNLVNGAKSEGVGVFLPKFKYDFEVVMNDALQDMGMEKAFGSAADFSRMGKFAAGNLFIYEVLHKTHITVDERGTKAGAVTKVEVKLSSMETDHVTLDRPFVYAIIDNATKLPVFMGTVINFK